VSEQVYKVLPGRGFPEAALLLGADYAGWLVHDGLRCYYGFHKAFHQALPLGDRYEQYQISLHGQWAVAGRRAASPAQARSCLPPLLADAFIRGFDSPPRLQRRSNHRPGRLQESYGRW
jgi:hypothetical protein